MNVTRQQAGQQSREAAGPRRKGENMVEVIETMKLVLKAGVLACFILIVAIGLVVLVACLISVIKSTRGK